MGERYLVIDRLKFSYEGLFNVSEIHNIIATFFYDKGYDYVEKINQELVTPTGKQFRLVITPSKSISDYFQIRITIKLTFFDVTEVEVEHDNQSLRMSQGLMRMMIDGYVAGDRKGWWSGSPMQWFLQVVILKYFYKQPLIQSQEWVESDVQDLYEKIRSYVNSANYRYRNN